MQTSDAFALLASTLKPDRLNTFPRSASATGSYTYFTSGKTNKAPTFGEIRACLSKTLQQILERVNHLTDPETNRTFGEINLIVDAKMEENGTAKVIFTPTSPYSPIAVNLGLEIKMAVLGVEGVKKVLVLCQGHMQDDLVNRLVNAEKRSP